MGLGHFFGKVGFVAPGKAAQQLCSCLGSGVAPSNSCCIFNRDRGPLGESSRPLCGAYGPQLGVGREPVPVKFAPDSLLQEQSCEKAGWQPCSCCYFGFGQRCHDTRPCDTSVLSSSSRHFMLLTSCNSYISSYHLLPFYLLGSDGRKQERPTLNPISFDRLPDALLQFFSPAWCLNSTPHFSCLLRLPPPQREMVWENSGLVYLSVAQFPAAIFSYPL